MNYKNIDPSLGLLLSQMIQVRQQVTNVVSINTTSFIIALDDFINFMGQEMQKQAESETPWGFTSSTSVPSSIIADPALSAGELLKTVSPEINEDSV